MATKLDILLEKLLFVVAPIVFVAAGLFLWFVHDETALAIACVALAIATRIMHHFHQREENS